MDESSTLNLSKFSAFDRFICLRVEKENEEGEKTKEEVEKNNRKIGIQFFDDALPVLNASVVNSNKDGEFAANEHQVLLLFCNFKLV